MTTCECTLWRGSWADKPEPVENVETLLDVGDSRYVLLTCKLCGRNLLRHTESGWSMDDDWVSTAVGVLAEVDFHAIKLLRKKGCTMGEWETFLNKLFSHIR